MLEALPSNETLLDMEPLELLNPLQEEVKFKKLGSIENEEDYAVANEVLNQSAAYICYFRQMETAARIMKRESRRKKKGTEENEKYLGVEEVFETFKKIAETQFELVSKLFTSKRLFLDEARQFGKTT